MDEDDPFDRIGGVPTPSPKPPSPPPRAPPPKGGGFDDWEDSDEEPAGATNGANRSADASVSKPTRRFPPSNIAMDEPLARPTDDDDEIFEATPSVKPTTHTAPRVLSGLDLEMDDDDGGHADQAADADEAEEQTNAEDAEDEEEEDEEEEDEAWEQSVSPRVSPAAAQGGKGGGTSVSAGEGELAAAGVWASVHLGGLVLEAEDEGESRPQDHDGQREIAAAQAATAELWSDGGGRPIHSSAQLRKAVADAIAKVEARARRQQERAVQRAIEAAAEQLRQELEQQAEDLEAEHQRRLQRALKNMQIAQQQQQQQQQQWPKPGGNGGDSGATAAQAEASSLAARGWEEERHELLRRCEIAEARQAELETATAEGKLARDHATARQSDEESSEATRPPNESSGGAVELAVGLGSMPLQFPLPPHSELDVTRARAAVLSLRDTPRRLSDVTRRQSRCLATFRSAILMLARSDSELQVKVLDAISELEEAGQVAAKAQGDIQTALAAALRALPPADRGDGGAVSRDGVNDGGGGVRGDVGTQSGSALMKMSVGALKRQLASHGVDFSAAVEKVELVNLLRSSMRSSGSTAVPSGNSTAKLQPGLGEQTVLEEEDEHEL